MTDATEAQTDTSSFALLEPQADFFVNLVDMSTEWKKSATVEGLYEGNDHTSGKVK